MSAEWAEIDKVLNEKVASHTFSPAKDFPDFDINFVQSGSSWSTWDLSYNKSPSISKPPSSQYPLFITSNPFPGFDVVSALNEENDNNNASSFLAKQFFSLENAPIGDDSNEQRYWKREEGKYLTELELTKGHYSVHVINDPTTGTPIGFREGKEGESDPTTSTSLLRLPGNMADFVRGSSSYVPFRPGGLASNQSDNSSANRRVADPSIFDFEKGESVLTTMPGVERGLLFDNDDHFVAVVGKDLAPVTAQPKTKAEKSVVSEYAKGIDVEDLQHTTNYRRGTPSMSLTLEDQAVIPVRAPKADISNIFRGNMDDPFAPIKGHTDEDAEEEDEEPEEEQVEMHKPVQPANSKPATENNPSQTDKKDQDKPETEGTTLKRTNSLDDILAANDWAEKLLDRQWRKKKADKNVWAVMNANIDVSNFQKLVPKMALEFPFDLDVFQKEAIYHLENNESVFIAAHTSAGKTVVAEYAIALAAKHMTRAIYTSPIKALSNQKFRDFKETFGDVGLITGDVSVHPEASCLIVTTEILRSMLYKGADLIRDVEWVIFDEVHYVNDLERGVVWEEVIIMLPDHVNLILLSATVPNTFEFADWIGRTKKKKVFVISTMKRPTPLEHYLYANDEVYKIVDSKGTFLNMGYKNAADTFKKNEKPVNTQISNRSATPAPTGYQKAKAELSQWNKLTRKLKEKNMLPVVVFTFSKKKCEENAYNISSDLTTGGEKSEIHVFITNAINRLKPADRQLPQVIKIKELLKRGIGVHHGGLLPIIKEVVEMLFSKGLCKILFATETFAMGVNMPARTVIFNSISKHDGRALRTLLPGEYTQMSGRAGRRGLDAVGTVIIACWHEVPEVGEVSSMILGKANRLESQFRLTYSMILNLLRLEDFKVEDMIKRSFSEFHSQRQLPEQQQLLLHAQNELKKLEAQNCIYGEPDIHNYYEASELFKQYDKETRAIILGSKSAVGVLAAGRVVTLSTKGGKRMIGVILKGGGGASTSPDFASSSGKEKMFEMLVLIGKEFLESAGAQISNPSARVSINIFSIPASAIFSISTIKIKVDNIDDEVGQNRVRSELERTIDANPVNLPEIDPIKDLKLNQFEFAELWIKRNQAFERMNKSKCHSCVKLSEQYASVEKEMNLRRKIHELRYTLSDANLQLKPEFETRVLVMQKLGYVTEDRTVLIKGRVARELNTMSDELIATEMIFENVLTDLDSAEIVAVLSSLLFQEKDASEPYLTTRLQKAKNDLLKISGSLARIQTECGLPISVEENVANLNFGLVEVVYQWANGLPFAEITQLTNVLEGSIVRCITRLGETCKEVRNAARIIGDTTLFQKMEAAEASIKRDIVFASSLYLA